MIYLEKKDLREARKKILEHNARTTKKGHSRTFSCARKLEFVKIKEFQGTFVEIKEIQGTSSNSRRFKEILEIQGAPGSLQKLMQENMLNFFMIAFYGTDDDS